MHSLLKAFLEKEGFIVFQNFLLSVKILLVTYAIYTHAEIPLFFVETFRFVCSFT